MRNVNLLKRQEGVESWHRWKDATTISDNTKHKTVLEQSIWKRRTKTVCPKFLV